MSMTKYFLEQQLEKICICDGGCSIDPDEHDEDCPARDFDHGSLIDFAEYSKLDR